MALKFLMVGLGGAIGAMLRYAISCIPYKGTFPVLTLITNLTGAVLIGAIVGLVSQKKVSDNTQLFLKTGICGGYTTFSTFSLETFQLFQGSQYLQGILYLILSVVGCLAGVWIGTLLTRNGIETEI